MPPLRQLHWALGRSVGLPQFVRRVDAGEAPLVNQAFMLSREEPRFAKCSRKPGDWEEGTPYSAISEESEAMATSTAMHVGLLAFQIAP